MTSLATHAGPYALGTFRAGRQEFAGVVVGNRVRPIVSAAGLHRPTTRELIEHWGAAQRDISAIAAEPDGDGFDLFALDVLPPVEPRQIFQAGLNYRSRRTELAAAAQVPDDPRSPDRSGAGGLGEVEERPGAEPPHVFAGVLSAMCGAFDDVILPAGSRDNDVQIELAAVIGRPARRVPPEQALAHVVGYTIVNDLTTRGWLRPRAFPRGGSDWLRAKNSPTFLPTGPFLVPAEFVGDPMAQRMTLRLNGQIVQDESTKDMLVDVAGIVSFCSEVTALLPGDLIVTGSPGGGAARTGRFLRPGDVIEAEITGLGGQRNGCVAEDAR